MYTKKYCWIHGIQKIQGELKKIIFNKHDEFLSVKMGECTVKKQGLCEARHNVSLESISIIIDGILGNKLVTNLS